MRLAVASSALVLAGCYCSHTIAPDAGIDGGDVAPDAAVRVTGCDDPAVWSASGERAEAYVQLGGGPCSPAQYPLHVASLSWRADRHVAPEERDTLARVCWRVVEAASGSGWSAGQTFMLEGAWGGPAALVGFERAVIVEGRVLRADGTIAFAVAPTSMQLDAARMLEPDADAVIAVMSREGWAERDAVTVWGERVSTDEVVDGTAPLWGSPITLHRGASGLIWRAWRRDATGAISWTDVALGGGERALLARGGGAVAIDEELLLIGREGDDTIVRHRIPLGALPRAIVGRYHYTIVQLHDALVRVDRTTGATRVLPIHEGVLLPVQSDSPPVFFDGASFVALDPSSDGLAFAESTRFAPSAEHLTALGTPLAVMHGVVLGERGVMLATGEESEVAGPRFASIAEIFGEGRLALIGGDDVAYLVERADGSRVLYEAPYVDFCD